MMHSPALVPRRAVRDAAPKIRTVQHFMLSPRKTLMRFLYCALALWLSCNAAAHEQSELKRAFGRVTGDRGWHPARGGAAALHAAARRQRSLRARSQVYGRLSMQLLAVHCVNPCPAVPHLHICPGSAPAHAAACTVTHGWSCRQPASQRCMLHKNLCHRMSSGVWPSHHPRC